MPIMGGMVTSPIAVLILLPVLFAMLKERSLRKGTLRPSAVGALQTTDEWNALSSSLSLRDAERVWARSSTASLVRD